MHRRMDLSSVACPALQYFKRYVIKDTILEKNKLLITECMFWFSVQHLPKPFLVLRRSKWGMIINIYIGLHVKYPLFLSEFMKLEFSRQIFEKYSNTKFRQKSSSGNQVVPRRRTDRQTDKTKLLVAFLNFANALKMAFHLLSSQHYEV